MTFEIILVFSILLVTVILFAFEVFSVDKTAFLIIAVLAITGLVSPEEAISGFSNSATITVLSLMIISIALENNGVIVSFTQLLRNLRVLPLVLLIPVFMLITGTVSAFVNTTAVVIVFIKILSQLSRKFDISESKLLMPISFAGILGGSCTLMGTSTNLIVNSVSKDLGAEAFSFFEFSIFGLLFLAVGIIYMTIASKWLPGGANKNLKTEYNLENYVTTVLIKEESPLVGKPIRDTFFHEDPDISILKLIRDGQISKKPGKYISLKAKDEILLLCDIETLSRLKDTEGLEITQRLTEENDYSFFLTSSNIPAEDKKEEVGNANDEGREKTPQIVFTELLILPGSVFIGKTLKDLRLFPFNNAIPIAIKKRAKLRNSDHTLVKTTVNTMRLEAGDRLLVETHQDDVSELYHLENIVVMRQHEKTSKYNKKKKITSASILLLVVGLAASGIINILVSALLGVGLLLLTGCLNLKDVYQRVNWEVIFLLAGMIPLGVAMTNTGADAWISEQLLKFLSNHSYFISLGSIFFITMLLSAVMSNNATAIIMTPVAIAVATGLDLSMKPFILSVLFGANFSFITPMGYQTNTLIYGMGYYKFKHFLIIGGILSVILWLLGTWVLSFLI